MTRQVLPFEGQQGPAEPWTNTLNNAVNNAQDTADAALALAQANVTGGLPGYIALDSYSGTDDQKLTAAMAAAQAFPGRTPAILFPGRDLTFSVTGRTPYNGMRFIGAAGAGAKQIELASAKYMPALVTLNVGTGTSAWFNQTAQTYDVYIDGIAFKGTGSAAQFWHNPAATLYACEFRNLSFYGMKHIFGSTALGKSLHTQVRLTGFWQVLGQWDTQFYIGGSDNHFFEEGYINIGGGGAAAGAGRFLFIYDGVGKTVVGFQYPTVNNGWRAMLIRGNGSNGVFVRGGAYEGMNAATPCDGNVIRVEGGIVTLRDIWTAYAMNAPTASEHGVIEVAGGDVLIDGCAYGRGNKSEATPWVYQSGGNVTIRSARPDKANATWTSLDDAGVAGKPRFRSVGGTFTTDGSVSVNSTL